MSFADGVWKLLRIAPGFSQRFPGTFDETGDKAEQVPESEIERGLAVFSSVSETQGAGAWKRSDVQAPARLRLYHATAVEHFVLSSGDERLRVELA